MFMVPGQRLRMVAIAPQTGTEAPIRLLKKDSSSGIHLAYPPVAQKLPCLLVLPPALPQSFPVVRR